MRVNSKVIRVLVGFLLGLCATWTGVQAQPAPTPPRTSTIFGNTTLNVSTTSASMGAPAGTAIAPWVTLLNEGPSEVFVVTGTSGVTATTSGLPIPVGASIPVPVSSASAYIAAITASGTAKLRLIQANGPLALGAAVGGPIPAALHYSLSGSVTAGTSSGQIIAAGAYSFVKICTLFSSTANAWLNLAGGTAVPNAGLGIPAGGGCKPLGAPDTPMPSDTAINAVTDGPVAQPLTVTGG